MKTKFTLLVLFCIAMAQAQPLIDSWNMNEGQYASYWQNSNGSPNNPSFVFHTTTILADVTKVCYDDTSVWVKSDGMTTEMGQFLNPGAPAAQNETYMFPRTPTVPTSKTISPKIGSIGLLVNGIPIYGLSNAHYYDGSGNNGMGQGTWNVEVYKSEGFVLDATLGAHPQQQGVYHSHAKPYRLYQESGEAVHSPIVGYAFDGYPVYGPYGYTNPNDASSAITRMRTGYSLRNITTRTTLPYGVALTAANYGPAVNSTYPIGTYAEDYEWLESNAGTLDKYNGRFCVTPEYPEGTYAYFVTIDAAGTPQFPYYIGIEYYGAPLTANLQQNPNITIPATATCNVPLGIDEAVLNKKMSAYPNPTNGNFTLSLPDLSGESLIEIFTVDGKKIFSSTTTSVDTPVTLTETTSAMLIVKVTNNGSQYVTKMMIQ
jgi:YHYH protein/Secretion system C-terminal sorting domain